MKKSNKKRLLAITILIISIMIHKTSFANVNRYERERYNSSAIYTYDLDDNSNNDSYSDKGYMIPIGITIVFVSVIGISIVTAEKRNRRVQNMIIDSYKQNLQNREIERDVTRTHIWGDRIRQIDPNFSEEKMLEWSKNLFVKIQNAWSARNLEPIRKFETKDLFEQHNNQIQNYIDTNRINVLDRIVVNYATIYKFKQQGDRDVLEIALKATMKDYIIDATTKEVLEGNKTSDITTIYKLTFERKTGILTPEGTEKIETTNCPNCGAPTEITSVGKCNYCGSIITTGKNNWTLSGLEPLIDK